MRRLRVVPDVPGRGRGAPGPAAIVLDNSNIAENYPGVSSPLTCSFTVETYRLIFGRLIQRLLGDRRVPGLDEATDHMAMAYQGRLYYRIDNWYHLLQLLPFHHRVIRLWQGSLGVATTTLPAPLPGIGWRTRARVVGGFLAAWRATPALMAQLEDEFAELRRVFAADFDARDNEALRRLFERLKSGVLRNWDITLVNDARAFVYTALARWLRSPVAGVALASLEPVRALAELRRQPGVEELAGLADDDAVRQFLATEAPLARALGQYIEAYGDRGPAELKLESPTFRTHPLGLVQLILAGAGGADAAGPGTTAATGPGAPPPEPGRQTQSGSGDSRGDAGRTPRPDHHAGAGSARPRHPVSARALQAVAFRESSRLNRTRLYGLVRSLVTAMAENLVRAGDLETADDVFYLTLDELLGEPDGLRQTVAARRREWAEYERLPTQARVVLTPEAGAPGATPGPTTRRSRRGPDQAAPAAGDAAAPTAPGTEETSSSPRGAAPRGRRHRRAAPGTKETSSSLRGTPSSAGVVEGEVVVVATPTVDARGKIVVAQSTDPGWVFLLSQAAGLIAERGSLLSHAAIVARELGLPAVVGVPSATTRLRTGDRVRLDAVSGRIDILSRADTRSVSEEGDD